MKSGSFKNGTNKLFVHEFIYYYWFVILCQISKESGRKKSESSVMATGHGRIIVQELLCGPKVGEGDWRVFEP